MARRKSGKGFLIGTVIGGLVAGVSTLLFAPKSGKDMRKDLGKKCKKASKKTRAMVGSISETAKDLADKAKDLAEATADKFK